MNHKNLIINSKTTDPSGNVEKKTLSFPETTSWPTVDKLPKSSREVLFDEILEKFDTLVIDGECVRSLKPGISVVDLFLFIEERLKTNT